MLNNVNYVRIILKLCFLTLEYLYILIKRIMEKQITKTHLCITVDKILSDIINEDITNKSRYIEWLIYQDMKQNSKNDKIKKIII